MKKPLLISTTLIALVLSATSIYAQVVAGTSIVDKMKAAAHSFTLSSVLNPTDTGLQSSPIKGKKTGDILTAGEWNRVLEIIASGSTDGEVNYLQLNTPSSVTYTEGGKVPFTVVVSQKGSQITHNSGEITLKGGSSYRISADLRLTSPNSGIAYTIIEKSSWTGVGVFGANYTGTYTDNWAGISALALVSPIVDTTYFVRTSSLSGLTYSVAPTATAWHFTVEKLGGGGDLGGGSSGSGWVNVPLDDTTDFDTSCLYRYKTWNTGHVPYLGSSPYYFPNAVDAKQLIWWIDQIGEIHHISSTSKRVYRIEGVAYPASGGITKIEKLCGGGGSGGTSNITWANFNGSGSVAMKWSNGITSIVRESAGNYRVTFATPRPNTDYGIICTSGPSPSYLCFPHEKSPTSFLIKTSNPTNNVDAPFVSLLVTPFDAGVSSGAISVYTKCTNAQSADSTNIPCYAASRSTGAGTDQYRVMSCTINDGVRTYTAASILNFNNLVANKWAISVNGGTIECVDGSILVAKIQ